MLEKCTHKIICMKHLCILTFLWTHLWRFHTAMCFVYSCLVCHVLCILSVICMSCTNQITKNTFPRVHYERLDVNVSQTGSPEAFYSSLNWSKHHRWTEKPLKRLLLNSNKALLETAANIWLKHWFQDLIVSFRCPCFDMFFLKDFHSAAASVQLRFVDFSFFFEKCHWWNSKAVVSRNDVLVTQNNPQKTRLLKK